MSWARRAKNALFTSLVFVLGLAALAPLIHLLVEVFLEGAKALASAGLSFFTSLPAAPGSSEVGGIAPAIAGTTILTLLSTLIGIPIAFFTGVFLVEFRETRLAKIARSAVMSLLEVPTILVGMMAYSVIVVPMGSFTLLAGAVALAIVILPYVATYTERALESVPWTYREAGFSLGLTRPQVVFRIVAGIARRGILAGVFIGLAKALGETAPLLFTIGSARASISISPLAPGDAIPLLIFQYAMTPYENWNQAAWGASLVLTASVLLVYAASRIAVKEVRL